jgi:gamma-glutamyltranspeptidase / glutathione hydrolase
VALNAMVATSQTLATRAGLRALERGGSAADAAIAAAAVLSVTEPMSTGLGGDVFSVIWDGRRLAALDAAGPAPKEPSTEEPMANGGQSATVPGAVAGWVALADQYGKLGLDNCLQDAIDIARRGFAVGSNTSRLWSEAEHVPFELLPRPAVGDRVSLPELANSLMAIAEVGPDALYRGRTAEAICSVSWLDEDDLESYSPKWVEPLSASYRDVEVVELPPPTQGVAALEALGLYEGMEPGLVGQVDAMRLSLEDAFRFVRDGADVRHLISRSFLDERRNARASTVREPAGGTVYLCAVDADRMAVSFIQSIFGHFGSGVVAPGTGIVLNNRAAGFSVAGRVQPGVRPYHTIIPGMLFRDGALLGPFGVMGGYIQAQAHLQLVAAIVDDDCDPQAALDRSRFRIDGSTVYLEAGYWDQAAEVESLGLTPVLSSDTTIFGGGQAILARGESLVGGSDSRRDGHAAGM